MPHSPSDVAERAGESPEADGASSPWSIPIRDAGPEIPRRSAGWFDRLMLEAPLRRRSLAVLGTAAVVAVLVGTAIVVSGGDSSSSDPSEEVLGSNVDSAGAEDGAVGGETDMTFTTRAPGETVAGDGSAPTTQRSETIVAPSTTPPPTTAAPAPQRASEPAPADIPTLTPGDTRPGWAAQLSSVPTSAGSERLETGYRTVASRAPGAVVLDGADWPGLDPSFWVIADVGHPTAADALAVCDAAGVSDRDGCFARRFAADGSSQGVCYRDDVGATEGC